MRRSSVVLAGFMMVITGLAVSTSASQLAARQSTQQEDVLPALLAEVRGLRAAMEQMASAGPRVQLALGRVQLQEQRVNNLLRRIEEGRSHLADAQRKYDQVQHQLRGIQESIREFREPRPEGPTVGELQAMQRETERELARVAAEVQRLAGEAAVMDADLATERALWIDLNQRMEALEQSLVRR